MNEELEYVLETIRFKTSIYRDKKKRNLTFNDDDYYSNILNEYITNLQQENARLKETFEKITNYIKEHDYDYIYLDCKFLETQIYNDLLQMLNKIKEN